MKAAVYCRVSTRAQVEDGSSYRCAGKRRWISLIPCPSKMPNADMLEEAVWTRVREALLNPDLILAEISRRREVAEDRTASDVLAALNARLKRLREREARLVRLYSFGEIDEETIRVEVKAIKRERENVEAERQRTARQIESAKQIAEEETSVRAYCERVSRNIERFDFEEKGLALEALQVRVTVSGGAVSLEGAIPYCVASQPS